MSALYLTAKQFLQQHPGAGKGLLARHLGIKTPAARRLIERYRGETQGHNPDAEYQRVLALKLQHPQLGGHALAKQLGITVDKARLHLSRWVGVQAYQINFATLFPPAPGLPPVAPPAATPVSPPPAVAAAAAPAATAKQQELQDTTHQDARDLSYVGDQIQTPEDLMAYAQVDQHVWEIERQTVNKWEVGMRDANGGVVTSPLFQIKIWLRRRVMEQRIEALMNGLLEQFKSAAPATRVITRPPAGDGLFELSILDLHLGKYCWEAETGSQYDLTIAARTFRAALDDLLGKGAALKPAQILLPIGNDFFNVDNLARTTTAGTPQDESGRWQESFLAGRKLMVEAIEQCRAVAPVQVVMVAGNHDTQRLYYLGETLAAWFRHCPDVQVDASPTQRKYVRWHRTLIGFTHGDNEPVANLPIIMATEQREAWACTAHHEWHVGHLHARQKKCFQAVADQHGVIVRVIPSLCPSDAWHKAKGYQGARAAEGFYFDPSAGCVAEFSHNLG